MRNVFIAALVLLAGCGVSSRSSYRNGSNYVPPSGTTLPPSPPEVPPSTPDYLIDANADVGNVPFTTYAITTNGVDWILGWEGDAVAHSFTGDVYCPVGCKFEYAQFQNALPGDSVNSIADNHIGFDAQTDANVRQVLLFAAPLQPITFDLFIDGRPAADQSVNGVVFPSGGQLATSYISPFNLVSSNAQFADQADLAPLFTPPKDKGSATFSLRAPAPRSGEVRTESQKGAQ